MNCYNGEKFLTEAINSVLNQKFQNFEIIFWDNKSNDKSKQIVQSYKNNKIKYFLANKHTNLGEARFNAVNQASGEFIAFLDVDDLWHPNKLYEQIKVFNQKDVGISITNTIYFNKHYQKNFFSKSPPEGSVYKKLLFNYFIPLETVMIRKDILKQYNLNFDKRFHHICDFDLFFQICYFSKLKFINIPLSRWRIHEDNASKKDPYGFIKEKKLLENKLRYQFKKNDKFKKYLDIFHYRIYLSEFIYFIIYENVDKKNLFKFIYNEKKISIFFKFLLIILINIPYYKTIISFFRKKKFLL
jgi:glycosyltransferase involved in cell wall biosynthesis